MIRQFSAALAASVLATLVTLASADAASQIYPNTGGSRPASDSTNVPVEQGKKGIVVTMQCLDAGGIPQNDCWPLVNGTPAISIGATPAITCANTLSPPAGGCGYGIGAFAAADPNIDSFRILYNGILPNTTQVKVTVTGATGNAGSTETSCPNAGDPGCTLSFTVGANTPKTAASTELVFDISGSMSLPAVPGGSPPATCSANPPPNQASQRICALKLAAARFLAAYQPQTMLGDKLGVVFFASTASAPGGVPNLVNAADPAQIGTIGAQINAQAPTSNTAIGQGLQLANSNGFAADNGSTNSKWVFLFTDGEQNVSPSVDAPTATQLTIGGVTYATATGGAANAGQIGVCPITAGQQTAVGFALLQGIANTLCKGQNAYIASTNQNFFQGDLDTYFAQLLTTSLIGDKFEISRDIVSTVETTPKLTFLANSDDQSLELVLANGGRAAYKLIAPDGTTIPAQPRRFAGGSVLKLDLPLVIDKQPVPSAGKWQVVFDPGSFGDFRDYHLIVVNDNASLATSFGTVGSDIGTGDPLRLAATILDDGKPVSDARVMVDITGPNQGLGNVLSKTKVVGDPPRLNGDNPGGAGAQKLLVMYANPKYVKLFGNGDRPALELQYCKPGTGTILLRNRSCQLPTGTDPLTSLGVYRGSYTHSSLEGHYVFTFHATGKTAKGEAFERTWKTTLFVRPKADAANTSIEVQTITKLPGGGYSATLRVTPRDKLGNYIGPGYDGAIVFKIGGDRPVPFAADGLDGSYLFRVSTAPEQSKIVLGILGQDVKSIDLATLKRGDKK
ncbi:MAG: VWA domain-containing protein [Devosia sp.]|nr:VWA domain-containing protein [Devosia sp.]